jgi:hypothetical protein
MLDCVNCKGHGKPFSFFTGEIEIELLSGMFQVLLGERKKFHNSILA